MPACAKWCGDWRAETSIPAPGSSTAKACVPMGIAGRWATMRERKSRAASDLSASTFRVCSWEWPSHQPMCPNGPEPRNFFSPFFSFIDPAKSGPTEDSAARSSPTGFLVSDPPPSRDCKRISENAGFHALPKRRVVERTFAWIVQHRRLVRDYERSPECAAAWVFLAMINRYS